MSPQTHDYIRHGTTSRGEGHRPRPDQSSWTNGCASESVADYNDTCQPFVPRGQAALHEARSRDLSEAEHADRRARGTRKCADCRRHRAGARLDSGCIFVRGRHGAPPDVFRAQADRCRPTGTLAARGESRRCIRPALNRSRTASRRADARRRPLGVYGDRHAGFNVKGLGLLLPRRAGGAQLRWIPPLHPRAALFDSVKYGLRGAGLSMVKVAAAFDRR